MKIIKNDRVYVFLVGLNKNLDNVKCRIVGRKPLPFLHVVFFGVRRAYGQRKVMMGENSPPTIEVSLLVIRNN